MIRYSGKSFADLTYQVTLEDKCKIEVWMDGRAVYEAYHDLDVKHSDVVQEAKEEIWRRLCQ